MRKQLAKFAAFGLALSLALGCGSDPAGASGTFADDRDGKTYKWVKIGTQTWMAENLNYDIPDNDTDFCYGNNADNCAKYGRLYDYESARAACPDGWHLPKTAEWEALLAAAGGRETAGKHLKAKSGWNGSRWDKGGNGKDKHGFAALPGGHGISYYGDFGEIGNFGFWWMDNGADYGDRFYFWDMNYEDEPPPWDGAEGPFLNSIRCVQGQSDSGIAGAKGTFKDSRDGQFYKWVKIGGLLWMAQNLNYDVPDDDTDACYDNDANCGGWYGRLYRWKTAMKACPDGWRLPSDAAWNMLMLHVNRNSENGGRKKDGTYTAGKYLKSRYGWNDRTVGDIGSPGSGEDRHGFNAMPGGYGRASSRAGSGFENIGNYGMWWSAAKHESREYRAYYLFIDYNQDDLYWGDEELDALFSVRCIRGGEPEKSELGSVG